MPRFFSLCKGADIPACAQCRRFVGNNPRYAADSYAAYFADPIGNGARKAAATKRRAAALALLDGQQAGVDDEAARKAVGDVFKSLPNSGSIKHHGRFG